MLRHRLCRVAWHLVPWREQRDRLDFYHGLLDTRSGAEEHRTKLDLRRPAILTRCRETHEAPGFAALRFATLTTLMDDKAILDKSSAAIRGMFAEVAPRYDLLNRVLSASLDVVWRRRCARSLADALDGPVLDLCCGTGDQAKALQKSSQRTVIASDFCLPMLDLAERKFRRLKRKPLRLAGDALILPFHSGVFAAVTVSFGLRNFADLDVGLREIHRVLCVGGQARFLEFALPRSTWLRAPYDFYLDRVLPRLGALVSPSPSAYRYLPDSVVEFPQRADLVDRMTAAGFREGEWEDFSGGTVCFYKGVVK